MSQPLHLKTGAKQREQAAYEYDSTLNRQEHIEIPLESGKVSENDDRKQSATENKTEASEKQKNMIQKKIGT